MLRLLKFLLFAFPIFRSSHLFPLYALFIFSGTGRTDPSRPLCQMWLQAPNTSSRSSPSQPSGNRFRCMASIANQDGIRVSIRMARFFLSFRIPPSLEYYFFPIKSIGIESLRPNVIPAFVQVVQSSPSHLRITMNQGSSPKESLVLFSASLNQQRQQSVQSLRVQSHKSYEPRPTSVDIDIAGTGSLLRFSKLRELHL